MIRFAMIRLKRKTAFPLVPLRLSDCALLDCKLRFLPSKNAEVSKNRVLLRAYQPGCVVNKSISLVKEALIYIGKKREFLIKCR